MSVSVSAGVGGGKEGRRGEEKKKRGEREGEDKS